jgi:hypothetical protein
MIGGLPVTKDMLAGVNVERVFDLAYADAKHEIPSEFLDKAHDEIKSKFKDERRFYEAMCRRWGEYIAKAKASWEAAENAAIDPDE